MNFYKWKEKDVLYVNKFGILNLFKSRPIIPGVILVPLLAFLITTNIGWVMVKVFMTNF